MPPLSDPEPVKSHKKSLRITDFVHVLHRPSSPGALSPLASLPLPVNQIPSIQKTSYCDLLPSQHLKLVQNKLDYKNTPIQEFGFFPSFISPDKVAPSPIQFLKKRSHLDPLPSQLFPQEETTSQPLPSQLLPQDTSS